MKDEDEDERETENTAYVTAISDRWVVYSVHVSQLRAAAATRSALPANERLRVYAIW